MNQDQQNATIESTVELSAIIVREALLEANAPDSLIKKVIDKLKGYDFKKSESIVIQPPFEVVPAHLPLVVQDMQSISREERINQEPTKIHNISDEEIHSIINEKAAHEAKLTCVAFNIKTRQFGIIVWHTPEGLYKILDCGAWTRDEIHILNVAEYKRLKQFDDTSNSSWNSPSVACIKTVLSDTIYGI